MFGLIGDSLNPPADAVWRGKIGWIGVRHQESAALAAAGQAKLSGQLAVCAGTTGSTHLISLPATALLASRLCVLSPTRRIPLRSSRSIEAPVPDQAAVVRDPVTLDDDPPYFSVYQKGPVLIDRQSETHQYALVMRKIVGMLRTSAFLQIYRGGAHNAPVIGEALDPQRAIRQFAKQGAVVRVDAEAAQEIALDAATTAAQVCKQSFLGGLVEPLFQYVDDQDGRAFSF